MTAREVQGVRKPKGGGFLWVQEGFPKDMPQNQAKWDIPGGNSMGRGWAWEAVWFGRGNYKQFGKAGNESKVLNVKNPAWSGGSEGL